MAILWFAAGAAWLQTQAELPALYWFGLLPLCGLFWYLLPPVGNARILRHILLLLLAGMAGYLYAAWRADLRLQAALPTALEGRPLTLSGRVLDLPERTPGGLRFQLAVDVPQVDGLSLPEKVQLFLPEKFLASGMAIRGGDCLQLTATLFRPHGKVNPWAFDYEGWLFERGIRASGTIRSTPRPRESCAGIARGRLDAARDQFRERLQQSLAGRPYAGVVIALAVGDQNAISSAQWTLFRHTGVTHLMSISGLHVTLFASLVYVVLQAVWKMHARLCLWLPARKAAALLGLACAAWYVAVAGFGLPAQRTLYMLAVVALALWRGSLTSPSRVLAAALLLVVLIDPWASFAPGFWLSFGAVAILIFADTGRIAPRPAWQGWVRAQWAITLALTAPLLALFHEISLVSPLANAFAIPLVSLLAVPLSLLAAFTPLPAVAEAAHGVLALTLGVLEWLDRLPNPVMHGAEPGWPALLLALAGGLYLLSPRGIPGRWVGAFLFLPLFFPSLPKPDTGEFSLTLLDVGQGLSAVVRTREHLLLFDAGPAYPGGEDAGSRVVAPYLHASGAKQVDMLVVSHDDLDHTGGALALIKDFPPAEALTSLAGCPADTLSEVGRQVMAALPRARACQVGQSWRWEGVLFQVLHPYDGHYENPNYADNERSCVIRISNGRGSVLLTADIERLGEMSLMERVPESLQSAVLVAPHHGSRTSSTQAFLDAVRPEWVVIPVGHRNRYHHPSPGVMARYRASGARLLRTDQDGAITLHFDASGMHAEAARQADPRYWHDRPVRVVSRGRASPALSPRPQ